MMETSLGKRFAGLDCLDCIISWNVDCEVVLEGNSN